MQDPKTKPYFIDNYEAFGSFLPTFFSVIFSIPFFWGTGAFQAHGQGFVAYVIVSILLQLLVLQFYYRYWVFDTYIYIRYPFRLHRPSHQLFIRFEDVHYILHNASEHSGGLYATKNLILINFGADQTFRLSVSKYGDKMTRMMAFFKQRVPQTSMQ